MKRLNQAFALCLLAHTPSGCAQQPQAGGGASADVSTAGSLSGGTTPIIDLTTLIETPPDRDPFADRPPPPSNCETWSLEGTYVEINTSGCSYVTLTAPILFTLPAGAILTATAWHTPLTATDAGAEAHLEILLGDTRLLSERVAIPAKDAAYSAEIELPREVPQSTPLYLHVHNHGANSYRFTAVTAKL